MPNPFDEPFSVKMSRKIIKLAREGHPAAEKFLRDMVATASERATTEEICRVCETFMQFRMELERNQRNQN